MTTWHLNAELAQQYVSGAAGQVFAASAEAHLAGCADCRALLVPLVDRPRLDGIWAHVEERVDAPRPGALEQGLRMVGVRAETARLIAATSSLRGSWLLAVAATLAFAIVAAAQGPRGTLLFLTLAPLLPVAGVAVAYGPGFDPVHEIGAAAPYSAFRLLLLRASAVLASTTVLAGVAAVLPPVTGGLEAAWLLPALGLTTLTLALSGRFPLLYAAAGVGTAWVLAVVVTQVGAGGRVALAAGTYAAFGAAGQLACSVLAIGSITALVVRSRRYTLALGRTS